MNRLPFWEGVVEDRNDPLHLGRVRVRVFGDHTDDKQLIPTSLLPWAIVAQSTDSAAMNGIGKTSKLVEGTIVCGYYRDGPDKQQPVVTHTIPGIPSEKANPSKGFNDPNGNYPRFTGESDINRLARGETKDTMIQKLDDSTTSGVSIAGDNGSWDEPKSGYAAKYPFNQVVESESGHVAETDDSPGAERLTRHHRTGTGEHILPDGSRVLRVIKDNYEVLLGDDYIFVSGNVNITSSSQVNIFGVEQLNVDSGGSFNIRTGGDFIVQAGGQAIIYGATGTTVQGALTKLNPGIGMPLGAVTNPTMQEGMTKATEAFVIDLEGQTATNDGDIDDSFDDFATDIDEDAIAELPANNTEYTDNTGTPIPPAPIPADNKVPPAKDGVPVSCQSIKAPPIDYNMQLSKRFKLIDLTQGCLFSHSIPNDGWLGRSPQLLICNLQALATNILEPLADGLTSITLSSGGNAAKKGGFRVNCAFRKENSKSQHPKGQACDLQFPGLSVQDMFEIAKWMRDNLPFDQMIFEHGNSAWIHVSYNNEDGNRPASAGNKTLSYLPSGWGGGKQYIPGFRCAFSNPAQMYCGAGGKQFK